MNFVQWAGKLAEDVQHGRSTFDKTLIGPLQQLAAHEARRQGIAPRAATPAIKAPAAPARVVPPATGTATHPDQPVGARRIPRAYAELPLAPYYFQFRDMLASDLRQGLVGQTVKAAA